MPDSPRFHHHFQTMDANSGKFLTDQMSIHLLELNKWREPDTLQNQDHWPYFFKQGKHWKQLPDKLDTPKMRQAMKVLETISDQEEEFDRYQAREDYLREQATILDELEQSQLREKAAVLKAEKVEQKLKTETIKAEQERIRLVALLRQAGIEP